MSEGNGEFADVYVALGSNLGDRSSSLDGAVAALKGVPELTVLAVSSYRETLPVGGPRGQPPFLNAALALRTSLPPEELLGLLQGIERRYGREREREVRWGPRRLDLDLLLFGEVEMQGEELTLPHPRMEDRLFVLEPLLEIAPRLLLPGSGVTIEERIEQLLEEQRLNQGERA